MKKRTLLYAVLLLLTWACSKTSSEQQEQVPTEIGGKSELAGLPKDPFYGVPDTTSILDISVGIIGYDAYEKPYFQPEKATIVVWPSNGRHLEIESVEQVLKGYAYDSSRDTAIFSNNIAIMDRIAQQDLLPGRYFVAVVLNDKVANGKNAFSSIEVELGQFDKIAIHKIFDQKSKDNEFETWDK
ncbi:MAG: hypothetical protein ACRDE7_14865 [Sphingobacterium sp.]